MNSFGRSPFGRHIVRILIIICVALFGVDFFYHRHVIHPLEGFWGFYAVYGFLACVLLVLAASGLRKILMRSEDYFDSDQRIASASVLYGGTYCFDDKRALAIVGGVVSSRRGDY